MKKLSDRVSSLPIGSANHFRMSYVVSGFTFLVNYENRLFSPNLRHLLGLHAFLKLSQIFPSVARHKLLVSKLIGMILL